MPSCPEWSAWDLAHHLTVVQSFWAAVVRGLLTEPDQVEAVEEPPRADTMQCQLAALRAATIRLVGALEQTPPETPAWTWSAEQTVGFSYRRQALEALVHRIDAELTVDARTPVDVELAADGVDEALRIMVGGCPPWGAITPDPTGTVRVTASDTGRSWLVHPARFAGTDRDGTSYDEPDIAVADVDSGLSVDADVTGTAEDLLCWLWGRPTVGEIVRSGDDSTLAAITAVFPRPIT